jgi:uncharacterized repeat protein (TIGR03987 family)
MDGRLILAIVTITLALAFYTIGVWSERRANTLKRWHLLCFWAGLAFDTTGTLTMGVIANSGMEQVAPLTALIHGATGGLAIALMILHAIWATVVLVRGSEKSKAGFHKFSIVVWSIWLVPYFVGMLFGMTST